MPGNPAATIVGDLATGEGIPKSMYDCIILTQTLPFIYDLHSAARNCYQALRPGGVLLVTVPGISQISRFDMDRWGDYWRFTNLSMTKLFCEFFEEKNIQVKTYGNVKIAVAFLHGLAAEELKKEDLDHIDPDYQLIISAIGVKKQR
jgi:SAM-dependent methyltransferase